MRVLVVAALLVGSVVTASAADASTTAPAAGRSFGQVVPAPAVSLPLPSSAFTLKSTDAIYTTDSPAAKKVGAQLAATLRPSTGYALPLKTASTPQTGGINLLVTNVAPSIPGHIAQAGEGYLLQTSSRTVVIRALTAAGLFDGVQTLRQLFPARVESSGHQDGPWTVPGGTILDYPRYTYRAAMLDVARHFFDVSDVERYIDEISLYKINYLHLHLTDDQGWRIAIDGMPALTEIGGSTGEAGYLGGFYTKADYRSIVAYAQDHDVTVIPEIEGPVHATAALASIPGLDCNGTTPDVYIGIGANPDGAFCTGFDPTYRFLDTVIKQIAALTPGPYVNIGGDEADFLTAAQYAQYVKKAQAIVLKYGKKPMGWQETLSAAAPATSTGIFWAGGVNDDAVIDAANHGAKVVMAPATQTYLDMRYSETGPAEDWLGLTWAGYIDVQDSYDWNPATFLTGLPSSAVIGVEAPLWTDTVYGLTYIEEMAFPRLPAIAELGWSPASSHNWGDFRTRLAAQGPRWDAMGIYWYPSPQVAWATN